MSRRREWPSRYSLGNLGESAAFSMIGKKPTKDISVFGVPDVFGGSDCPPDGSGAGGAVAAGRRGGTAAAA